MAWAESGVAKATKHVISSVVVNENGGVAMAMKEISAASMSKA
jgi:hypothetical protein